MVPWTKKNSNQNSIGYATFETSMCKNPNGNALTPIDKRRQLSKGYISV